MDGQTQAAPAPPARPAPTSHAGPRSTPGRSLGKRAWYGLLHITCRVMGVLFFRVRCRGREGVPPSGGALLMSSHQSHFDPVLIGLACDRRLNFLARESLFHFGPFRWLIQSLDAIPIDRDGLGLAGLKETLRRLKRGEIVLMFPEGTRTADGLVAPLKPGFCALARRADVPLVPAAIVGAFEAWPKSSPWPRRGLIQIEFGNPLTTADIAGLTDVELVAEMERRIVECHRLATESRQRALRPGDPGPLGGSA